MEEDDPRVTYDLVMRVVPSVIKASMSTLLKEFTHIKRSDYDSLLAYISRLPQIKQKLDSLGCVLPDTARVAMALWSLQDSYPRNHDFWVRDFEKAKLNWDDLRKELARLANSEANQPSLIIVKVNKDKNNAGGGKKTRGSKEK